MGRVNIVKFRTSRGLFERQHVGNEGGSWEEEGSGAPTVRRRGTWHRIGTEQQQGGSKNGRTWE